MCVTAAEMWSMLDRLYMESSLPNHIHLPLKFYTFKTSESRNIDENVDDFLKIVAELSSLDVTVSDEVQAILFLTALSSSFDQLKHTLKYGRDSLTLEEVISAARSREREMLADGFKYDKGQATSLYTSDRGRSSSRSGGGSKSQSDKSRGRSGSNSKSRITCWFCKKTGHMKKDCFARKKRLESDDSSEAGVVIEQLKLFEALNVDGKSAKDVWVLDSGCTVHMTTRRDWFHEFYDNVKTNILLGDDHIVESQGYGTILVDTQGGSIKKLQNVKYVPNLRRNLISVGTLDVLGYKYGGGDGKVRYFKDDTTALTGTLINGVYVLDGGTKMAENCNVDQKRKLETTNLWHSRLGHMSLNNLRVLTGKAHIEKKTSKISRSVNIV